MTTTRKVSTCPVCDGTKRQPYTGQIFHNASPAWFDPVTHTMPCQNCGGQYMSGAPTGFVWHNYQDQPCKHDYEGIGYKNCLSTLRCKNCGDTYEIDSGD